MEHLSDPMWQGDLMDSNIACFSLVLRFLDVDGDHQLRIRLFSFNEIGFIILFSSQLWRSHLRWWLSNQTQSVVTPPVVSSPPHLFDLPSLFSSNCNRQLLQDLNVSPMDWFCKASV